MESLTFTQFVAVASAYYGENKRRVRFGQAVFIILEEVRPEIANELRGTPLDPFHKTSVSDEVWAFIEDRW